MSPESARRGSLTIVGTGMRPGLQTTPEARIAIERAEQVLFLLDPVGARWIASLNPSAESLGHLYSTERPRRETYRAMVQEILGRVRRGFKVCVAFYGHPGVFVDPSHEAIRQARAEGFEARMTPGISAEDCLVADLGIDPAQWGWQAHEATDFLIYGRRADTSVQLVLWQIGALGEMRARRGPNPDALRILVERLAVDYGEDHEVVLYLASPYPVANPIVTRVRLGDLSSVDVQPLATLYVPPARLPSLDQAMAEAFGVSLPEPP